MVENPPTSVGVVRATGLIPGSERSPEKKMATHSSILAWKIPWTEESGGLQSWGRKELEMTAHTHTQEVDLLICFAKRLQENGAQEDGHVPGLSQITGDRLSREGPWIGTGKNSRASHSKVKVEDTFHGQNVGPSRKVRAAQRFTFLTGHLGRWYWSEGPHLRTSAVYLLKEQR